MCVCFFFLFFLLFFFFFFFVVVVVVVFHFVVLVKARIGSENIAINEAFILANMMHKRIVIVENTRVQLLKM